MLLCFYFAGTTGHYYLAKVLSLIAEKLHFSQNLAGLTLIALGNMACDVIVAILAGAESGVKTSFCSLLGGGNLILGMIMSTVIFLSKGVKVVGINFVRDLITYLIGLSVVVFYGFNKEVKLYQAIIFLSLYFVYVGICVLMEKLSKKKDLDDLMYSINDDLSEDFVTKIYDENSEEDLIYNSIINSNTEKKSDNEEKKEDIKINENPHIDELNDEDIESQTSTSSSKKKNWDIDSIMQNLFMVKKAASRALSGGLKSSISFNESNINVANYSKLKIMFLDMYLSEKPWEKKNLFEKIKTILIDSVMDSARKLTIPPFEQSLWNKTLFTFWPISISIFLTISLKLYYIYQNYFLYVIIYYVIMIIICYIINRKTYRGSLPNCPWMLLIPALLTAILWIYTSSSILMNIITAIKVLLPIKLPDTFLIMTIVAYGNATPDFVVECSLANGGYAEMALSGAIGGPVFGLLCGFGVCLIQGCLAEKNGTTDFQIFKIRVIIMAFILVVFDVIQLLINGIIMKFDIKRKTCIFGYCSYFVYFLGIVLISFVFQWDDKV
jgi:sodium/potassium/calcium exchanger 6